jgi:nucleoside-diphosphate-sugar epimerase
MALLHELLVTSRFGTDIAPVTIFLQSFSGHFSSEMEPLPEVTSPTLEHAVKAALKVRKAAIIIGGAGFIGSALSIALRKLNDTVIVVDSFEGGTYPGAFKRARALSRQSEENKYKEGTFRMIAANINDVVTQDEVISCVREIDEVMIFHLAAQPGVRMELNTSQRASNYTSLTSVCAFIDILLYGGWKGRITSFVFTSSSSVYGDTPLPATGWVEEADTAPKGSYAMQKRSAEEFLRRWLHGTTTEAINRVIISRPFSVYGPWGRPDMAILRFISACYDGRVSPLAESADGSEICRDFTFIDQAVASLLSASTTDVALLPALDGKLMVLNIGTGTSSPLTQLAALIASALRRTLAFKSTIAQVADAPVTRADATKVKTLIGSDSIVSLSEGINKTVQWFTQMFAPKVNVIVVIATKNRADLLRARSLPSVAAQTYKPTAVCIVNDAPDHDVTLTEIQNIHKEIFREAPFELKVLSNSRTPGASGAWNTGIVWALQYAHEARLSLFSTYIAILDDDDEWESHHLCACARAAQATGSQQIIPGIIRVGSGDAIHHSLPAAASIVPSEFFAGNPHIQGSNMFISIAAIARAGLFGEHLPSTTDRDLMARVSSLSAYTMGYVPLEYDSENAQAPHTVRHYAEAARTDRLSTPGSHAKSLGQAMFLSVHGASMREELRQACIKRAETTFHVKLLDTTVGPIVPDDLLDASIDRNSTTARKVLQADDGYRRALVVGIISDSNDGETIRPLLQDLAKMQMEAVQPSLAIFVLVLANNSCPADSAAAPSILEGTVNAEAQRGQFLASVLSLTDVLADVKAGRLPDDSTVKPLTSAEPCRVVRLGIATARTLVQRYAYMIATDLQARMGPHHKAPIAWILDDDKSFSPLLLHPDSDAESLVLPPTWMGASIVRDAIAVHEAFDAAVVIGSDTGAPPLPMLACLRLQLVDVLALLQASAACASPDSMIPTCAQVRLHNCLTPLEAARKRKQHRDFYHDMAAGRTNTWKCRAAFTAW